MLITVLGSKEELIVLRLEEEQGDLDKEVRDIIKLSRESFGTSVEAVLPEYLMSRIRVVFWVSFC